MKRKSQQGVALVITLILLSAITFMAVTFLVVTRRERERATTQSNQSDATFAANAAIEQAKNQIISLMLARTNGLDSGLMVSTNYISPAGFFTGVSSPTNVSYYYPNGTPIKGNDLLVNLTNMLYLPRVPVFVNTNQGQYSGGDFRYYYDANRNGRYDPNGWTVETNSLGLPIQIAGTNVLGYHVAIRSGWAFWTIRTSIIQAATGTWPGTPSWHCPPAIRSILITSTTRQRRSP
jgi:hypothetical protein